MLSLRSALPPFWEGSGFGHSHQSVAVAKYTGLETAAAAHPIKNEAGCVVALRTGRHPNLWSLEPDCCECHRLRKTCSSWGLSTSRHIPDIDVIFAMPWPLDDLWSAARLSDLPSLSDSRSPVCLT